MSITTHIAKQFVERSAALGYKGKARDNAAIDYIVGAAAALQAINHEELGSVTAMAFIVSVRGYAEVIKYAEKV